MTLVRRMKALAMMLSVVVLGVMAAPMAQAVTVTVNVLPESTPYMTVGQQMTFTALTSDNNGVSWALATGSGQSKGTLSTNTSTTAVYVAPANVSSTHTVTLTATSIGNSLDSAVVTITLVKPGTTVKTPIAGLTAMGDTSYSGGGGYTNDTPLNDLSEINTHPGIYAGAVINVLWSQLQPSATDSTIFDFSAIEGVRSPYTTVDYSTSPNNASWKQGLAEVAAYNAANPSHPVKAKLRVHVDYGQTAPGEPGFALAVGGITGGIPLNGGGGSGGTNIGAYWTTSYETLWQGLVNELAAAYDNDPRMGEISVESCASVGGEPYVIANNSDGTDYYYMEYGTSNGSQRSGWPDYTDAQDQTCYANAVSDYSWWKATPLDSDYNTFNCVTTSTCNSGNTGSTTYQVPWTNMAAMRNTFTSPKATVSNHALGSGWKDTVQQKFYAEFQVLGSPVEFQTTVALDGVGACKALENGITYAGTELELHQTAGAPNGAQNKSATCLSANQLGVLSTILSTRNNPTYTCTGMPAYNDSCPSCTCSGN